jgi:type I restriction enzyme S subunit
MERRYASYKDSGVEWIGEIPSHWEVKPLKYFSEVVLGKMLTPENKGGQILKPYLRSQNVQVENCDLSEVKEMWFYENELEELRVNKDDLLVNEGGDVGRTAIWKGELYEIYIQNSINKVAVLEGIPRYYFFQFTGYHSSGYFDSTVNRVSIPHLTKDKLSNIKFISPPIPEQEQIVAYLDEKTSQIDSLISLTERKIELLKHKRTALINEAVTKGLNPNVEYKDSGVEWIGQIPSHWFCVKTNKVFRNLGSGTTPSSEVSEYYMDGVHHWITTTDLNEGIVMDTISKLTDRGVEDYPNLTLYPSNSIYISMYGGKIGKIGLSLMESYCNQSVCVLPKNDRVDNKFYYYWYLSSQEQLKLLGRGGGQPNINKEMIKEFPSVKLPLSEQEQIVKYLDEKTTEIDTLVSIEQRRIETLKEYRQSLISEVVTGKLRVCDEVYD